MQFNLFKDESKEWRWNLTTPNGNVIADSAEGYKNKKDAKRGIELVMTSSTAEIVEKKTPKKDIDESTSVSITKTRKKK